MNYIEKDHIKLPYEIETKRIKHTYFRVKKDHIHVTTSRYTKKTVIIQYLNLHFKRLHDKLSHTSEKQSNETITLWGKTYKMVFYEGSFNHQIIDHYCHIWHQNNDIESIKKAIYLREMKHILPQLEREIYPKLIMDNLSLRPIKIKYLKSKFGSYHRIKDEITLNAFLATTPIDLLRYVMYHEYAHILVFNHSKAFYDQLGKWLPNHKGYQKTLKSIAIY